ncbi:MAG: hypothetical protein AAB433_02320 [Nitrospirota bacterium]
MKPVPIRLGDQFVHQGHILEVFTIYPGGKVLLVDRARSRSVTMYHRDIKDWPRVTPK